MKKQFILLLVASATISNSINANTISNTISNYVNNILSAIKGAPQSVVVSPENSTAPQNVTRNAAIQTTTVTTGKPSNINLTASKDPVVIKTTETATNYSNSQQ